MLVASQPLGGQNGGMSIADVYRAEGLLPYDQLPDITDPTWNPDPFVAERQGTEQYLMALGLAHRTDRGNNHYRVLTEYAANFMVVTELIGSSRRVGVHEGVVWPVGISLDLAYAQAGEPMWLRTFGDQTNMPVQSAELPRDGWDLLLEEGFTEEEAWCYFFDRQTPQYQRQTRRLGLAFEDYMRYKMDQRAQILECKDFDFSLKNLIRIHERIHKRPFDPTDTHFFYQQSVGYMLPPTSRIQEASIVCNMGRDVSLWRTLQDIFNQDTSVLTVFGQTHILAILPALERLGTHGESYFVTERDLGSLTLSQYDLT